MPRQAVLHPVDGPVPPLSVAFADLAPFQPLAMLPEIGLQPRKLAQVDEAVLSPGIDEVVSGPLELATARIGGQGKW